MRGTQKRYPRAASLVNMTTSPLDLSFGDDDEIEDNVPVEEGEAVEAPVDPLVDPFHYVIAEAGVPGIAGVGNNSQMNEQTFIWGTTVEIAKTTQRIRDFILNFKKDDSEKQGYYYLLLLQVSGLNLILIVLY